MEEVKLKARAKINLGLDVIKRREDGYHEVKMIMQTVDIYDSLSIRRTDKPGIFIRANLKNVPTDERNLIYKAAALFMKTYPIQGGVSIHLKKMIPIAAGMAGGSADAAATFVGMNQLLHLEIAEEQLRSLAVSIGADVPYCIMGGTALSEGIGERLTPLPQPPSCYLVIAKPNIYVSTRYVYEHLHANEITDHPDIDAIITAIKEQNLVHMAAHMENVLERVTAVEHPIIETLKSRMVSAGAIRALMSGSGPTVFGIFETKEMAQRAYKVIQQENLAKQIFLTTFTSGEMRDDRR
ncbi:MAG: 4-(cytidine 5'-diphospho)-2-C-methyl-D-erythritol kinase [Lachnospiraceae bacterium]